MKLTRTILNQMPEVSNCHKAFFMILIQMLLSIQGKINFRSLSRYSGLVEKTLRRWFQKSFNFAQFNTLAIQQLEKMDDCICVIDACFLEKSGKSTYGIAKFWNGCASRAQKGLETTLAAIVNVTTKTAYALHTEQTPTMEGIKSMLDGDEVNRIDFYLSILKSICVYIKQFTILLVCDGFYTKKKFVDGVLELGFTYIGKLRLDANLKIIYRGERRKGPGRPRKFEGKCNIKKLDGFEFVKDVDAETRIHVGVFYSPSLEREIKVVAVTPAIGEPIPVALLFSTDTAMDPFAIYTSYAARFQIEFFLRDAQQFTGFSSCQSRKKESIHYHTNASLVAINLVKIQEQLDDDQRKRKIFSMHNHKIKNHNKTLISRFFSQLGIDLTLIKSRTVYNDMLNYGVIVHDTV